MTTASIPTPLSVICPVCNAQPTEPCTQPTDRARKAVRWFHYKRIEAVTAPHSAELETILEETRLTVEKIPTQPIPAIKEPPRHPLEQVEWEDLEEGLECHTPCGAVFRPGAGVRALHEAVCPSLTHKMTLEEISEARKRPPMVTRAETEAQQEAWAVARYKRSTPKGRAQLQFEADAEKRRQGLKPFTVYSEGYAATGERGGATSMGTHWGRDFNDAIERWRAADPEARSFLSFNGTHWSYWGCRLFDNLRDAQRSFG